MQDLVYKELTEDSIVVQVPEKILLNWPWLGQYWYVSCSVLCISTHN